MGYQSFKTNLGEETFLIISNEDVKKNTKKIRNINKSKINLTVESENKFSTTKLIPSSTYPPNTVTPKPLCISRSGNEKAPYLFSLVPLLFHWVSFDFLERLTDHFFIVNFIKGWQIWFINGLAMYRVTIR